MTTDKRTSSRAARTIKTASRGADVFRNPMLNKGTAFSPEERQRLGLEGLLPFEARTRQQQAERIYEQLQAQPDDLQKYLLLSALLNRNAHLFYRVLIDHLEELMPIVYTPTVGTAVQRFSRVFQGGGGVWITPDMKGRMADVLRNIVGSKNIRLLVVTDNESILGLGDQGAGGVAISVGKLALYTAAAGIDPCERAAGEPRLRHGQRRAARRRSISRLALAQIARRRVSRARRRIRRGGTSVMPDALVQWEDFRKDNALAILDRYVDRVPSFNDDIQGTGAVVMAGLEQRAEDQARALADQRIVIYGAGAAGLGVTRQIKAQLAEEGVTRRRPGRRSSPCSIAAGSSSTTADQGPYKRELAWPAALAKRRGLDGADGADAARRRAQLAADDADRPVGRRRRIRRASRARNGAHVERPVIFPSSNPSANSEAQPADLYAWTDCRCLVATGSPFRDVECGGRVSAWGRATTSSSSRGSASARSPCARARSRTAWRTPRRKRSRR